MTRGGGGSATATTFFGLPLLAPVPPALFRGDPFGRSAVRRGSVSGLPGGSDFGLPDGSDFGLPDGRRGSSPPGRTHAVSAHGKAYWV